MLCALTSKQVYNFLGRPTTDEIVVTNSSTEATTATQSSTAVQTTSPPVHEGIPSQGWYTYCHSSISDTLQYLIAGNFQESNFHN